MKKKLFLFLLITSTQISNAQCNLEFQQFFNFSNFTFSELENFALKNGYSYKGEDKVKSFICDKKYSNTDESLLIFWRVEEDGDIFIQHIFF